MIGFFARILRTASIVFLSFEFTYYIGMVFVRVGRFMRIKTYDSTKNSEFHKINMINGVTINVDRFSYMGGSVFWSGFHHINEILFLKSILEPQMTFIDVGANQGEFSLFASSILSHGKVLAFEPVSFQRNLLELNRDINSFSQLHIYPFGLSNSESKLPIYTSKNSLLHHGIHEGLSSLYISEDRKELQEFIDLKVFDDIFFESLERLDFIKIDVEGAELFALQGMIKSIKEFLPLVLIEINEETFSAAGYSTLEIYNFFNSINYKFFKIQRGKIDNEPVRQFDSWGNYVAKYTI